MSNIITTHSLPYEQRHCEPWELNRFPDHSGFRIGTVDGIFRFIATDAIMVSVVNNSDPGNGHIEDFYEWFEYSAVLNGCDLIIAAVLNKRFLGHLLRKRGFTLLQGPGNTVVKRLKKLECSAKFRKQAMQQRKQYA